MQRLPIYLASSFLFVCMLVSLVGCSPPEYHLPIYEGATPTLRIVMKATDPAQVTLAAGRPQLIEFFAYW